MGFEVQKITSLAKTEITCPVNNYKSIVFTNTSDVADNTIDLFLVDQSGADIKATAVYAAETEAQSTSSVTLTVDNGSGSASVAADDGFLNERVYKSDGNFLGTCTTVTSTTVLVFSGGLTRDITDNDILHTGTRYSILNNVVIPPGVSLKLTSDEFNFNNEKFNLYIRSDNSNGLIDIIKR